jgi:hypothetical protein
MIPIVRRLFFHRAALLVALGWISAAFSQEKSLYWRSLEVRAQLDREGILHVTERQKMIFTGN